MNVAIFLNKIKIINKHTPVDLYQTAKVSKLLLMMEQGSIPLEYKGKSLSEINIDPNVEYAIENEIEGNEIIRNDQSNEQQTTDEIIDIRPLNEDAATITKKSVAKRNWTDAEIKQLEKQFRRYIHSKTYPPTKEIQEYIKTTGIKRSVAVIKAKIQHLIKLTRN
ncbi:hypothetical protein QE152_g23423 [Popillia japonica]|uniref:Uncharacterized protein n=1 Tax=Popillia japonica TaxID=7064 RepID=A0AAW1KHJ0_POPJA